jgi:hypothetical protein
MLYILQIDATSTMEFWILSCAEIYQQSLGGQLYAVDISRPVDGLTDQVITQLDA